MELQARPYERTPPLTCDACEWPVGIHEVVIDPDGFICGLIICSLCISENLEARKLEE